MPSPKHMQTAEKSGYTLFSFSIREKSTKINIEEEKP